MRIDQLVFAACTNPESIESVQVMELVERYYDYTPVAFINGDGFEQPVYNAAGENEGSCKIFALGQLLNLDEAATLACFGEYYRDHVLANPDGNDHANIRTFMRCGWAGISFAGQALSQKQQQVH